jgi:hypothetical protein
MELGYPNLYLFRLFLYVLGNSKQKEKLMEQLGCGVIVILLYGMADIVNYF